MSGAIAGTRHTIKAGEKLLYFLRLAVRTGYSISRGGSKNQFFKFRLAICASVLKYWHMRTSCFKATKVQIIAGLMRHIKSTVFSRQCALSNR